jgi:hypothetical protein
MQDVRIGLEEDANAGLRIMRRSSSPVKYGRSLLTLVALSVPLLSS